MRESIIATPPAPFAQTLTNSTVTILAKVLAISQDGEVAPIRQIP
jgi:hypothetical protein